MYYPDVASRAFKDLAPGIRARTFWGDQMLMARVDLDAGAVIPTHSHPHEQSGVVLAGELDFDIGGDQRHLVPGDLYLIPGGVPHSVKVGSQPAQVVDIFSPVREEYKY